LNEPYSLSAWISVNSTTLDQTFLSLGDGDASGSPDGDLYYLMQKSSSSEIAVRMMPWGLGKFLVAKTSVNNPVLRAAWYNIVFTRDSLGVYRMYVNGVYNTGSNFTTYLADRAAGRVGRLDVGPGVTSFAGGFVGNIAHVKLWSRTLSTTEIANEAKYTAPASTNGLVGWWPFQSSSALGEDASGNGRTMQVNTIGTVNPIYSSENPSIDTYKPVIVYGQIGFGGETHRASILSILSSVGFAGNTKRRVAKAVDGVISFSNTLKRRMIVYLLAILSFSRMLRTRHDLTLALSSALTFVGGSHFALTRKIAGAVSFQGAITRAINRLKAVAGVVSFSGTSTKRLVYQVAGGLSFAGSISRKMLVKMRGYLTPEAVMQFGHRVIIEGELYFYGWIGRNVSHRLVGALSFAGDVKRSINRFVTVAGALNMSGVIQRRMTKHVDGVVTIYSAITRKGKVILSGVLGFSHSFGMVRKGMVAVSGAISFVGSVPKVMTRSYKGALSFGGVVRRNWLQVIAGTVGFNRLLHKTHIKNLAGSLEFIGLMGRSFAFAIYGTVKFSAGVLITKGEQRIRTAATLIGRKLGRIRLRGQIDE
jgi:hypothetical protein